jgi:hypothetical protein
MVFSRCGCGENLRALRYRSAKDLAYIDSWYMNPMTASGTRSDQTPVFIVGMNGSGTTMMLDHLGHHPDLFGFKLETYILPHYLLNENKYGDLRHDKRYLRLWNDLRSEYAFRRMNKGRSIDLPSDWETVARSAAGVFDRIMREFAEGEGKKRWCEKTPLYALHISTIAKAFPEARFIHMVRDGRDCAISNQRRWGRHPANTIYRWKYVVAEARRQGGRLGQQHYLEVRYEDVTNDAVRNMRSICEFVGVAFDERVLLASRPRQMTGQKAQTIVKNRGRSTGHLSASTVNLMDRIAGQRLVNFGYSTGYPEDDLNPVRAKILWWSAHDALVILARRVRNKLTVQKNMTWSLFLSRLKATIRLARNSALGNVLGRRDRE